jgi:Restriction endonuclease
VAAYSKTRVLKRLALAASGNGNQEKGRALEDLACYIFEKVPGISIAKRNALNDFSSEEIDVAFWNKKVKRGFYFLDDVVIVECKNWSSPLGSAEVNWFDTKIKHRGLSFGILIAANGITGNPADRTAAHQVIATAQVEKRRMVVITSGEIRDLESSDDLVLIVQEKLCELAVSGTLFM